MPCGLLQTCHALLADDSDASELARLTDDPFSWAERLRGSRLANFPDDQHMWHRHPHANTSFWYINRFGPNEFGEASRVLKSENDGKLELPFAKGTRTMTVPKPMDFKPFVENDGSKMPPNVKWTNPNMPPPPVMVSDLHKWTADVMMRRAKEAALIADHAVIEAWKEAENTRYWTRQAQAFEAAAMRALRHSQPGKMLDAEPPLNMDEYPIVPDHPWQKTMISPPPGWETPGAAGNPLHSPAPSNMFTIHSEPSEPGLKDAPPGVAERFFANKPVMSKLFGFKKS